MNNKQNVLAWIQNWYSSQINGEWEHSYGLKIDTLDNPGWSVVIDLVGTSLENTPMTPVTKELAHDNWVDCSIVEGQFVGYGGTENLLDILEIFRELVEKG